MSEFKQGELLQQVVTIAKAAIMQVAGGETSWQQIAHEDKSKKYRFLSPDYGYDQRTGVKYKPGVSSGVPFSAHGEKTGIDEYGHGGSIASKLLRKMKAVKPFDDRDVYLVNSRDRDVNTDYRVIGKTGTSFDSQCDLIRNLFAVGSMDDIVPFVDLLLDALDGVLWGELVNHPERGYRGNHFCTNKIPETDGLCAELQVATPLQAVANDITHSFSYMNTREGKLDKEHKAILDAASREIYRLLWDDKRFETVDQQTRAKIITRCKPDPRYNDREQIIESLSKQDKLLQILKRRPFELSRKGIYVVDNELLVTQAKLAQEYAQPRQENLNKWCKYIFKQYESKDKQGLLRSNLTEEQAYVMSLFEYAVADRVDEFHMQIKRGELQTNGSDAREHFQMNYGNEITGIQKKVKTIHDNMYGKTKRSTARTDYDDFIGK